MTIEEMQRAINEAGWQWIEHIFNDNHKSNCFVQFTQDTNPSALINAPRPKDMIGWGRFSRLLCWQMAYNRIILGQKTDLPV